LVSCWGKFWPECIVVVTSGCFPNDFIFPQTRILGSANRETEGRDLVLLPSETDLSTADDAVTNTLPLLRCCE